MLCLSIASALRATFSIGYYWWSIMVEAVSVSDKGQVTISKRLREKYGIRDKVVLEEGECGIVLRRLPLPSDDLGSLKALFRGKTARELLEEALS